MRLDQFITRVRDDAHRFQVAWERAMARHGLTPPRTHSEWVRAFTAWLKAERAESLSERPTKPRAARPAAVTRR